MADVVVQLPIQLGEESQAFGSYLNRFMEARSYEAERWAATADAPYLMVRSDPAPDRELKVLIFQDRSAAQAFSTGWAETRRGLKVRAC
jgi:hypothetical protein